MDIIQVINKNKNLYKHLIYKIKICLTCDYDEESWNKLLFAEKLFNELEEKKEIYLSSNAQTDYNILSNNYLTVEEILNDLKEDIVAHYKMASIIMLDNMKIDEISKFYDKIKKVMKNYINIKNASTDIFYYSGREISSFIKKLLIYIKNHDIPNIRFIPIPYLEKYENIITIDYKEWITLIKTLRSTMKYLNDIFDDEMNKIKDEYILLNVYYFIVISGGDH